MYLPRRTRNFLGVLPYDPNSPNAGNWWYNSSEETFKFYNGELISLFGDTFTKTVYTRAEEFGRPNANPPSIVDQDNLTLYSFTLNTDKLTIKIRIPEEYHDGAILFFVVWTNDGGTDDNGRTVKWQFDYQVGEEGDVISGSHTHSPKSVEDTYTSNSGWVEHHTDTVSIDGADFSGKLCLFIKLSAVTPSGTALTSESHLIGICMSYTAKRYIM